MLPTYLIVHDGSEAKDADVDIILLAHQAGVLQGPAPRESAVPGEEGAAGKGLGVLAITLTVNSWLCLCSSQKGEQGALN